MNNRLHTLRTMLDAPEHEMATFMGLSEPTYRAVEAGAAKVPVDCLTTLGENLGNKAVLYLLGLGKSPVLTRKEDNHETV